MFYIDGCLKFLKFFKKGMTYFIYKKGLPENFKYFINDS